jgi:hypothetical protein
VLVSTSIPQGPFSMAQHAPALPLSWLRRRWAFFVSNEPGRRGKGMPTVKSAASTFDHKQQSRDTPCLRTRLTH